MNWIENRWKNNFLQASDVVPFPPVEWVTNGAADATDATGVTRHFATRQPLGINRAEPTLRLPLSISYSDKWEGQTRGGDVGGGR